MKKNRKVINFRKRDLLFVDLETTGLDVDEHEIIEVGCLVVDGKTFEVKKEYHAKVKPEHIESATKEALKISRYSEKGWKDARPLRGVLKEIVKLAPGAMIAGWKVDHDWGFLKKALKRHKITHDFDYHLIDIISIAYIYLRDKKKPEGLSLRKVARALGIKVSEQHAAMTDIKATYKLFMKLLEK